MAHQIVGYHCGEVGKCEAFVNQGALDSATSKKMLGEGMYFWDNHGNARFWLSYKRKKFPEKSWTIVKADICVDDMLDLLDPDTIFFLRSLAKDAEGPLRFSEGETRHDFGDVLKLLEDSFPGRIAAPKVIRAITSSAWLRAETLFLTALWQGQKVCPDLASRMVYCVRDTSVLSSRAFAPEG